jgi:hypothetical protein
MPRIKENEKVIFALFVLQLGLYMLRNVNKPNVPALPHPPPSHKIDCDAI